MLKEKFKILKHDLKHWNKSVFGVIDENLETKKAEIEIINRIDGTMGLEEEEIINRNRLSVELLRDMIWKENMYQKAKNNWIKEGDVNTWFYHNWINKRFKINSLEGLLVENH